MAGRLFLIPTPLGVAGCDDPARVLPPPVLETVRGLRHFVVEAAKTARAFLKSVGMPTPLQELQLAELNEHTAEADVQALLQPLLAGHDLGLLSEAGCPAVADPGAALVALAQERGIAVVPLIGPSSLLLALMASGLNGQQFAFLGYLPAREEARKQAIRALEKESRNRRQTQIFIETPYRNAALLTALLALCHPETRLAIACDLTLPTEWIKTRRIADWRKAPLPDLMRRPAVFLLLA